VFRRQPVLFLAMTRRAGTALGVLTVAAAAAVVARMVVGPQGLDPPRDALEWSLRGWRILAGLAVGSGLAVSGVALQSLLRNALAAPAVLGLTSGAGFGVTVAAYLGLATGGVGGGSAALIGSVGALAVVYLLAQRRGLIEPVTLILVGVIVSLIAGAGTVLLQHLMPDRGLVATTRWLFGSLRDDTSRPAIVAVFAVAIAGSTLAAALGRAMDAAALDDDESRSVGLRLDRLRLLLFSLAGILTAGSVLLAGPVGFVGLICPHAVRLIAGPANRVVVIGSALAGGAVIVGADALVRVVDLGGGRMPIGVVTAILGGPVFIALLRSRWVTP